MDSLRKRIDDYYANRGSSFVGNKRDYIRWALEVPGVGWAHCIPLYFGPNSLKIILFDSNGDPATEELCKAVEKYIFGEDHNDINRLAPIGVVKWEIAPPTLTPIKISANFKLKDGYSESVVRNLLEDSLKKLFMTLVDDEQYYTELRYVAVSDAIYHTDGVADFKHLRVNDAIANVKFHDEYAPYVGEIIMLPWEYS